jgi:hypothetical protein
VSFDLVQKEKDIEGSEEEKKRGIPLLYHYDSNLLLWCSWRQGFH